MLFNLSGKGNYPYACARAKAKKSLLLTKDNYPKLLMMDLSEIGRFLGETQYQAEITELASRYSGVNLIELGTSRNLARTYSDILGFCTGDLRDMIEAYLCRWDFWNLKTILRGKYYGASAEEIQEDLVPAGKLSAEHLNSLIALEGNTEVLEAIRRKEGLCIPDEVMTAFEESGALDPIEDFLDKIYYARLLERIRPTNKPKKLFVSFVKKEIDVTNLRTLLKLKRADTPLGRMCDLFIDGGEELNLRTLSRLAGLEDFRQMADELSNFKFFESISEGLEEAKNGESLSEVMFELQKYLVRQSERFSHIYPLSVLPVLDFLLRKKIEVDNIRIIARGKESRMDLDVIKNLLVV